MERTPHRPPLETSALETTSRQEGRAGEDAFEQAVRRVEREEAVVSRVGVVAGLQLALGALGVLAGGLVFAALAGFGLASQDPTLSTWLGGVGTALASIFGLLSLPMLAGGFGLLRRKGWARRLVTVLGVLELFWVPVGLVIGGYSLYVLFQRETRDYFEPPALD
jgi:hypothetical protein